MTQFSFQVSSDTDYEYLLVEALVDDELVFILNRENGYPAIELLQHKQLPSIPLEEFMSAIKKAKEELLK